MFHIIQDAVAIVRNKRGIYKQCKVYRYKRGVYIGVSGGYARLLRDGDVGTPDMSWIELTGVETKPDSIGRLEVVC